jgi:hypothetical protein
MGSEAIAFVEVRKIEDWCKIGVSHGSELDGTDGTKAPLLGIQLTLH